MLEMGKYLLSQNDLGLLFLQLLPMLIDSIHMLLHLLDLRVRQEAIRFDESAQQMTHAGASFVVRVHHVFIRFFDVIEIDAQCLFVSFD